MSDARLESTRRVECVCEVPPGAGTLRLPVSGVAVYVVIERRCSAERVDVTHSVRSATPELFSEDGGVGF